jgi:hypothetical protein
MEQRLRAIEDRLLAFETKAASFATKEDVLAIETSVHKVETSVHKELHAQTWRLVGITAGLIAVAFFLGRYVIPPLDPASHSPTLAPHAPGG